MLQSFRVRSFLVGLVLASLFAAPAWAQEKGLTMEEAAEAPPERSLRERFDQPITSFGWGPAGTLLLYPREAVLFAGLRRRFERADFLGRFWGSMTRNCPPGENPARELFWQRVEEANGTFTDEGLPGWNTDRGRIQVLRGAPESIEKAEAIIAERPYDVEIWRYPAQSGLPSVYAFRRQQLSWYFTEADPVAPAEGEPWMLTYNAFRDVTAPLVQRFREGCELTEEQRAEEARIAWKQQLWELGDAVLAGEDATVDPDFEPALSFFPAQGDATFTWLRFALDAPLAEGERVVAMLHRDGDTERFVGEAEFPFEVREIERKFVAQVGRSLAPGRYAIVAGILDGDNAVRPIHAAEHIIMRLPPDRLRLTNVVLARTIEPVQGASEGPYRLGGFEVVPRLARTIYHGEDLAVFFQVVGLEALGSTNADLAVTYTFQIKRGEQYRPIGRPVPGSVPWATPIVPAFPTGDFKLGIEVLDKKSGQKATKEVLFSVAKP